MMLCLRAIYQPNGQLSWLGHVTPPPPLRSQLAALQHSPQTSGSEV
jgi:hypothetical protein